MDGSSGPFVFLIQSAGIVDQNQAKKFIKIKKTVRVEDGDKWVEFKPFDGFQVSFEIDFDHPLFTKQKKTCQINFSTTSFVKEVSRMGRLPGLMRLYRMMAWAYAGVAVCW